MGPTGPHYIIYTMVSIYVLISYGVYQCIIIPEAGRS
jgi:hypothetical protein